MARPSGSGTTNPRNSAEFSSEPPEQQHGPYGSRLPRLPDETPDGMELARIAAMMRYIDETKMAKAAKDPTAEPTEADLEGMTMNPCCCLCCCAFGAVNSVWWAIIYVLCFLAMTVVFLVGWAVVFRTVRLDQIVGGLAGILVHGHQAAAAQQATMPVNVPPATASAFSIPVPKGAGMPDRDDL